MKLRKPCQHGRYEEHWSEEMPVGHAWCPGGVFLPDDTLVIEKENGEWPEWVHERARATERFIIPVLDALSVREAE